MCRPTPSRTANASATGSGATTQDGDFVVEQQAYIEERDGQIGWMRVVCSGFRPLDGNAG
jgi:hypothetical protein